MLSDSEYDTAKPAKNDPNRRCIASGEVKPKAEMIRFVVGPDQQIVPDVNGKLPGRGIWVSAQREWLERACDKQLFSKAARKAVKAEGLVTQTEALLRKHCLQLLGMGVRRREVVAGFEKVRSSLLSGEAVVWIEAADSAEDGRKKLRKLADDVPVVECFNSQELSHALGKDNVHHLVLVRGVTERSFLTQVRRLMGLAGAVGA